MAAPSPFGPELFDFLRDLKANNEKPWFEANRDRYEEALLGPCKTFVLAFRPRLREISSHFQAEPTIRGGSLFRIHRNLRFRPDAPPYKTAIGVQFRHVAGKDVHAPGFYLHLEPESEDTEGTLMSGHPFVGMGIWHPDRDTLTAIREAIVEDPESWTAAAHDPEVQETLTFGGDSLKLGPVGFDRDHPLIDDIKRKDFVLTAPLTEEDVISPGFLDRFEERCRAGVPVMRWLCDAVGVDF